MDFSDKINLVGLPEGNFRSINGYASEYLVIGRALQCGYVTNFRAWRDAPYDLIIDYNGLLYRVEIKGSTVDSFSVTGGSRSGKQIDRTAKSRTHIVSRDDCEFLIGITGRDCKCFILPIDVIEIFNMQSLRLSKLKIFEEKWEVLMGVKGIFTSREIHRGFISLELSQLKQIIAKCDISITLGEYEWDGFKKGIIKNLSEKEKLVLDIWKFIYSSI